MEKYVDVYLSDLDEDVHEDMNFTMLYINLTCFFYCFLPSKTYYFVYLNSETYYNLKSWDILSTGSYTI